MNSRRARIATLVTAAGVATQTRQRRRKSVSPSLSEVAADYKWLHVEARYNYEALDTGSAWLGYNFRLGDQLSLEFTPMVGGVFGNTNGVARGYALTLAYWKLDLCSEGEYLFDTDVSSGDFTYTWSELGVSPLKWLRFGVATQRTRVYQTDMEIHCGPFLGLAYERISFTAYVFNPAESPPTFVLALNARF